MSLSPGDTFLINAPGASKYHLFIVLGVNSDLQELIAVPLNTVTIHTDPTVVLKVGDHPFIKHDSAVSYNEMRAFPLLMLDELEGMSMKSHDPSFVRSEPCDPELLKKLVDGAFASQLASRKLIEKLTRALDENG